MVFIIIFYLVLFTWSFFESVGVIYAHDGTGEGGDLSEADEQRLMDLPFGVDKDSAEQHRQSSDGEDCRGQKLYVEAFFHMRFLKSGAKVEKKNEATKKVVSQN